MRKKIIIVAIVIWVAAIAGGGAWERFEQYLRDRSIPAGQIEVQNLKDLYSANLYDETLGECARAESDPRYTDYLPQIRYIEWATNKRLKRLDEADNVQRKFLQQYPDHFLAADMYFSTAMNLLAAADYKGAADQLEVIHSRYPTAPVAKKAEDILQRLQNTAPTTAATVTQ
jgi:outer membrane protein assembly factor BamD (BamD/ComL family)